MNAIVQSKPEPSPVVQAEGATLLAVINRAASDPNTDVDKMERLMAMYERIDSKRAEAAFSGDLADMQDKLPSVGERGNAAGRYTYALWEDINAAIKPILKAHGFALSFRTSHEGGITVTGVLTHRDGHREETSITLPADSSGNKNAVQAVASSVSYGKRYTAGALLNLTSHGEDDDAFAAGGGFDISGWRDAINGAADKAELDKLRDEIKQTDLPARAKKEVVALWQARAKAVKS